MSGRKKAAGKPRRRQCSEEEVLELARQVVPERVRQNGMLVPPTAESAAADSFTVIFTDYTPIGPKKTIVRVKDGVAKIFAQSG